MSREPDEAADVALAETLVFGRPSLTLERYSRAETLAGRTPDFKVLEGRALKAFCEVKSPRDDWLDEQLDQTDAFEIAGGLRADPVFSRIARHVKKAASQFEAVNPDHDLPNILVFVNHAIQNGPNDLYETLTGYARTEGGGKIATMTHIAEGRIGEARSKIDLYVWIDRATSRVRAYFFNDHNPAHVSELCGLLGIGPNDIKR